MSFSCPKFVLNKDFLKIYAEPINHYTNSNYSIQALLFALNLDGASVGFLKKY